MMESVVYLVAACLGVLVGCWLRRAPASGGVALVLPFFPVLALVSAMGRS